MYSLRPKTFVRSTKRGLKNNASLSIKKITKTFSINCKNSPKSNESSKKNWIFLAKIVLFYVLVLRTRQPLWHGGETSYTYLGWDMQGWERWLRVPHTRAKSADTLLQWATKLAVVLVIRARGRVSNAATQTLQIARQPLTRVFPSLENTLVVAPSPARVPRPQRLCYPPYPVLW